MTTNTETNLNLDIDDFAPDEHFLVHDDGVLRTRTVRIWPHTAEAWLKRNLVNRRLSLPHVERLSWDMTAGNWVLTHQGLAFNRKGELVDGQHRLYATRLAGRPIVTRVTFNCDAAFGAPMDNGKVRTDADITGISPRDSAVAKALLLLETRETLRGSPAKVAQTFIHHEPAITWARAALPMQRGLTANLVAGFVYAWPVEQRRVEAFAEAFLDFTGAHPTDPVVVLRRHVARFPSVSSARLALTLATLKCLQAHCENQAIARLYVNEQGYEYFTGRRGRQ